jgi:hypothetical protein
MCDSIVINGGNMSIQISGPSIPPDGSVTAAKINSGAATVGFVLTANGAAGATFAELPAAGGGILASGATVGATAQAQIFTTGDCRGGVVFQFVKDQRC